MLGVAGEVLGYDRYLKSNTTKRRTHSLFRQGCMLYELIPTNAAGAIAAVDRTVHHDARRTPGLCRYFRSHLKMKGVMRAATDGVVTMVAMTKSVTIVPNLRRSRVRLRQ